MQIRAVAETGSNGTTAGSPIHSDTSRSVMMSLQFLFMTAPPSRSEPLVDRSSRLWRTGLIWTAAAFTVLIAVSLRATKHGRRLDLPLRILWLLSNHSGPRGAFPSALTTESRSSPTGAVRAQRPERRPHFRGEELRLLPGGEVPAPVDLVVVGDARVHRLDPTARGSPDLARERREADRNRDGRRSLRGRRRGQELSELPVPPGGGGAGARQPVQRDVVDDGLPSEIADGLAVDERTRDLVI